MNLQSLNYGGDHLVAYLETLNVKFDVVCLTETRISDGKRYDHLFPRFTQYHSYYKFRKGGGTAVYIRNHLESKELLHYACNFEYSDFTTVEIKHQSSTSIVSSYLRLPYKHCILNSLMRFVTFFLG